MVSKEIVKPGVGWASEPAWNMQFKCTTAY